MKKSEAEQFLEIQDDSNQHLHQTATLLKDTVQIADSTSKKLDAQGEQIHRIDEQVSVVQYNADEGKRKERSIYSIAGTVMNWMTPSFLKPKKKIEKPKRTSGDSKRKAKKDTKKEITKDEQADLFSEDKTLLFLTPEQQKQARETDADSKQVIVEIDEGTKALQDAAKHMHVELEKQNAELDKVDKHVVKATDTLKSDNQLADKILGRSSKPK